MSAAPAGIFLVDSGERVVECNPAAQRILQRNLSELREAKCGDLLACVRRHEDPGGCALPALPEMRFVHRRQEVSPVPGGIHDQEIEILRDTAAEPRSSWFMLSVEPVVLNGQTCAIVALHGITDRKRRKTRCGANRKLFAGPGQRRRGGLRRRRRTDALQQCGPAVARHGRHLDPARPMGGTLRLAPSGRPNAAADRWIALVRAFKGEIVRDAGMAIVAKGEPPRFVLCNGTPFFDAENRKLGAVVAMRDITGRICAEEALRESQRRQAEAEQLAAAGAWLPTLPTKSTTRWPASRIPSA